MTLPSGQRGELWRHQEATCNKLLLRLITAVWSCPELHTWLKNRWYLWSALSVSLGSLPLLGVRNDKTATLERPGGGPVASESELSISVAPLDCLTQLSSL